MINFFVTPFVRVAEKESRVEEVHRVHREDDHRPIENVCKYMSILRYRARWAFRMLTEI